LLRFDFRHICPRLLVCCGGWLLKQLCGNVEATLRPPCTWERPRLRGGLRPCIDNGARPFQQELGKLLRFDFRHICPRLLVCCGGWLLKLLAILHAIVSHLESQTFVDFLGSWRCRRESEAIVVLNLHDRAVQVIPTPSV